MDRALVEYFRFRALVIKLDFALFVPMGTIVLDKYDNYNNLFDGNNKDRISTHHTCWRFPCQPGIIKRSTEICKLYH